MDLRGGTTIAGYTIWHTGNTGTGSGFSADLLQEMSPSTNAGANTIVQRDGAGDITAITGIFTTSKTSTLKLLDAGSAYSLSLVSDSTTALTADRTLTLDVNNAARNLDIYADLTVGAAANYTGAVTVQSAGSSATTIRGPNNATASFGGAFSTVGAFSTTVGTSGLTIASQGAAATTVTLPATGSITMVDLASSQALTGKTYNGVTLTSTALTFPAAGTINSTTTSTLTLDSTSTGAINIGTNANAKTITIGNISGATGVVVNSGTAGVTFNQIASGIFKVAASAAPTTDMVQITNTGFANITAGVNALNITYVGGAAAVESCAIRTEITPGGTSGGTWSSIRVINGASVTGVITNGIKFDAKTVGQGTANVLWVGTGWDNILNYNGTTVISGTGQLTAGQLTGTIPSAVLGNSSVYIGTTGVALNRTSAALTLAGITLTDGTLDNIKASSSSVAVDLWSETTTGNITIASGITSGTYTVGGTASTGAVSLFPSTKAITISIGSGATEAATTKAINIGTAGIATSVTNINIGSAVASSTGTTTISSLTAVKISRLTTNGPVYTSAGDGTLNSEAYLALTRGGTAATLTASNGGIVYSTSSALAILAGNATASKMLLSGANTTPTWSTSTIPTSAGATAGKYLRSNATNYVLSSLTLPDTAAVGDIWYASTTAIISALPAVASNYVLCSNGAGVAPSWKTDVTVGSLTATAHIHPNNSTYEARGINISASAPTTESGVAGDLWIVI